MAVCRTRRVVERVKGGLLDSQLGYKDEDVILVVYL